MKSSRIASIAVVGALAAASTVLVATPAAAETTVGNLTFYGESDFGAEVVNGEWPANDWFFGHVGVNPPGSFSFGPAGLTINDGTAGVVQILNQNVTTPEDVGELIDLLDSVDVYSLTDDWHFQLPFFGEPGEALPANKQFTTLRPVAAGPFNHDDNWSSAPDAWVTSWAIPGFAAGATGSFEDLAAALYAGADPELLAYGLWFGAGDTPSIFGISWDGAASGFGPVPTRTITPTSLTVADFASTGITFSATGWMPGLAVYLEITDPDGDLFFADFTSLIVEPDGSFSFTLLRSDAPTGTYSLYFDDDALHYRHGVWGDTGESESATKLSFDVTATPLPATGAAVQGLVIAAGILLLAGMVITVLRVRRA